MLRAREGIVPGLLGIPFPPLVPKGVPSKHPAAVGVGPAWRHGLLSECGRESAGSWSSALPIAGLQP